MPPSCHKARYTGAAFLLDKAKPPVLGRMDRGCFIVLQGVSLSLAV